MSDSFNSEKERIVYFDYLRLIACFFVIVIHSVSVFWNDEICNDSRFIALNLYDSLSRWSVPAFVMISGALFLGREISIKRLYGKNILRLFSAFLFWSVMYLIIEGKDSSPIECVKSLITGNFHMWFILMIIGLYMFLPILNRVVSDRKLLKYLLLLALTFSVILPFINLCILYTDNSGLISVCEAVSSDINFMNFGYVSGYIGYFLLGYYLNTIDIKAETSHLIFFLGILGFAATYFLTDRVVEKTGKLSIEFYGDLTLNVLLTAIGCFVFAKYIFKNVRFNSFVSYLSRCTFGAYIIHMIILNKLIMIPDFSAMDANNLIFIVPILALLTFVISMIISAILNKIPVINKYLV